MRDLLRYYRPYARSLALAVVCNLLTALFTVVSVPVLQPFLQLLFQGNVPSSPSAPAPGLKALEQETSLFFGDLMARYGREQALLWLCVALVLIFFGKNLFRYLSMYCLATVRNGIVRDIRQQLTNRVLALPLAYFSEARKGDLMSRLSVDVQEVEASIFGVVESVAREPFIILGSLAFMVWVSPQLLVFVLALMVFSGLIIGGIGRSLRKQSGRAQQQLGLLGALTEETLSGLRIIKGFNAENWQRDRFARENNAYARLQTRLYRRKDLASPLSEFLGICVVALLLWFGARQVFAGTLSGATFITFLYAFYNVLEPAKALSGASYSIRKGMGAVNRIREVLDAEEVITEKPGAVALEKFTSKIEFRNVTFQYPNSDRPVLDNISLTIPYGKVVALVGASGAGKSTIADLLPRFYDVNEGQILIDGLDIRDVRLRDLRNQMGIVSQEAVLFNDTVRSNIAFGLDHATDAEIEAAAKAAHAHDFITALPEGYDSNIGDRGSKLSGGQRQRLTIARALLRNSPILILDEATSALDSESEQLVQAALERLLSNRTALVIAHRLSTIQHADEIVVMDNGSITERGTHDELMAHGQVYKKLVALQAIA